MSRLPTPGADDGAWGDVLNSFLHVSHTSTGTLNDNIIGTSQIQDSAVTATKLSAPVQQILSTTVLSVNTKLPVAGAVTLDATDVGAQPSSMPTNPAKVGLLWQEEFTESALSLATDTGGGVWRTRPRESGGTLATGYIDYAGSSYNANYTDATRLGMITINNSVLSLKAVRSDNSISAAAGASWYSVQLSTNHLLSNLIWSYGYFEFRMRLPVLGRGMFPAIWLFNADSSVPGAKAGAEIDLFEVFGNPTGNPWQAGVHYNNGGLVSDASITGETLYTSPTNDDTSGWHRYGLDWQAGHITLYKDGAQLATLSRAEGIQWFNGARLGIRVDIVMDPNWLPPGDADKSTAGDPSAGISPQIDIDYIRVYSTLPTLPTGSADPLAASNPTTSGAPSRQQIAPLSTGEQPDASRMNALIGNDAEHENRITKIESPYQVQTDPATPIRQYSAAAGATAALISAYNASGNLKFELSPDGMVRADGTYMLDPTSQNGYAGAYIGQKDGTRRLILHNGTAGQEVQLDNNGAVARLIVAGSTQVSVSPNSAIFNVPKIASNATVSSSTTLGTPLREVYFLSPSGAITITVPVGAAGQSVSFVNTSASTVTLSPASGTLQTTTVAAHTTVKLISDGTNWYSA